MRNIPWTAQSLSNAMSVGAHGDRVPEFHVIADAINDLEDFGTDAVERFGTPQAMAKTAEEIRGRTRNACDLSNLSGLDGMGLTPSDRGPPTPAMRLKPPKGELERAVKTLIQMLAVGTLYRPGAEEEQWADLIYAGRGGSI